MKGWLIILLMTIAIYVGLFLLDRYCSDVLLFFGGIIWMGLCCLGAFYLTDKFVVIYFLDEEENQIIRVEGGTNRLKSKESE